MEPRVIDAWVNVNMGGAVPPEFLVRVKEDYFKAGSDFFKNVSVDEMIALMDRVGMEKAIITTDAIHFDEAVAAYATAHPDRFSLGVNIDPRQGMRTIRRMQEIAAEYPVATIKVTPFMFDIPPNDATYYSVYSKCIELDLPITVNTGIPGPPMPGECQHPMLLDKVCIHFPELKLVMAHGADPWWDVAIRLMLKYKNLYLMTSAYSPKYFPAELIHFMNTRGKKKIIYASDHPVLSTERCIEEAQKLDLREGVLDLFLYENARRLFFPEPAETVETD